MRVSFLVTDAFLLDETVRCVLALADGLSRLPGVEVEVISVFRRRETPALRSGRLIHLGYLVNSRSPAVRHSAELAGASDLVPGQDRDFRRYSPISDAAVERYAKRWRPDVIVVTSPGLAVALGRCSPAAPVVLWSHEGADSLPAGLAQELLRSAGSCAAVAAVTAQETTAWRARLESAGIPAAHIPPPVAGPDRMSPDASATTVVAIGGLESDSGFPELLTAFSEATDDRRQWDLLILGDGSQRDLLVQQAEGLGIRERLTLGTPTAHLEEVLAQSGVWVSASSFEPTGARLLEAMHAGVAVVSSDCPVAPREILRDGENGISFPTGSIPELTAALDLLTADPQLRARLGQRARDDARAFATPAVADRLLALLQEAGVEQRRFPPIGQKARGTRAPA